jgi:hypothetical protein
MNDDSLGTFETQKPIFSLLSDFCCLKSKIQEPG